MPRFRTRIWVALCGVLLFAASCAKEERPPEILSEEQIVPILKDMQIAYAGVDQTVRNPSQRNRKYEEMNQLVLKKHDMDKDLFYTSYDWYQDRPVLMDTIFQRVINELNQELVQIQNQRKARPGGHVPELK